MYLKTTQKHIYIHRKTTAACEGHIFMKEIALARRIESSDIHV